MTTNLVLTKERPTEPGYYWLLFDLRRYGEGECRWFVSRLMGDGHFYTGTTLQGTDAVTAYAGPIEAPPRPAPDSTEGAK